MQRWIPAMLLLGCLLASPQPARAAERWYLGGAAGKLAFDLVPADFDDGSITAPELDDEDRGWKVWAGYRMSGRLALEGGFVELGRAVFEGSSDGTAQFAAGPVREELSANGVFAAAVVTLFGGKSYSMTAKYGYLRWNAKLAGEDSAGRFRSKLDERDSLFGAAVNMRLTPRITLRGEWERFHDVGLSDIELVSLGASIQLGSGR